MGKVWVLDTETKGTGAEMVPLEKLLERRRSRAGEEPVKVIRRKADRDAEPEAAAEAAEPHRFRVADAITGQSLADDVGVREAVAALGELRSVVEARIDVWDPAARDWRPLGMGEKKVLWDLRR